MFIGIICILSLKKIWRIDFHAVYGETEESASDNKMGPMQRDIDILTPSNCWLWTNDILFLTSVSSSVNWGDWCSVSNFSKHIPWMIACLRQHVYNSKRPIQARFFFVILFFLQNPAIYCDLLHIGCWYKNVGFPGGSDSLRLQFRINPWVRKIPWEGNGNPLQYSLLENFMERGASWATVHGVTKSWTWLRDYHFHKNVFCLCKFQACLIFHKIMQYLNPVNL